MPFTKRQKTEADELSTGRISLTERYKESVLFPRMRAGKNQLITDIQVSERRRSGFEEV